MELIAEKISKKIKDKIILNNVCATFQSGKIYGIVGRNGSGKTMLFRALSGLIKIDSGDILLDGKRLHNDMEILPDLGIMIENAGLYPELSGFDNLKFLTGINKKVNHATIREYIKKVGLDPNDKRPFSKYSLGMKQRIIFAQAIFEAPHIIMLDEPTNALDEEGSIIIRNLIAEQKKPDTIILIASHNKEDIAGLADVVYKMNNGTLYEA